MSNVQRNLIKFKDKVKPRILPARVGWQDGTINSATRPNYIRLHWPDGVQFEAWNDGAPMSFGAHVNVIEDPDVPGLLKALAPRQVYSWQDWGYSIIKPHRINHQWPNSDWVPVEMRQFMPLNPSASAFVLTIWPGWVKTATTWFFYPGSTTSLASNKPAAGAIFALIAIDDAGALAIIEGDVTDIFSLTLADVPDLPVGYTPLCLVRLYAGQAEIKDTGLGTSDLIDVRFTSSGGDAANAIWGNISGDINDQVDVDNYQFSHVYLGDPTTDGSWQIIVDGNNLSFQRRESGAWVSKGLVQA